jgi:competence ComEA-like helix-hairpin-helix protein
LPHTFFIVRFRDHFSFTTSERRGTIALLIIISILLSVISVQRYLFYHSNREINFSETWTFTADSLAFTNDDSTKEDPAQNSFTADAAPHSVFHKKELFLFDPNGLSEDDWVKLGLSPAQARVVKKYEAKGGKFNSKEDVKKLFVISDEFYREIEPYIVLPDESENNATTTIAATPPAPKKVLIVELNSADSALLVSLNGIGPVLASRILAYREKLGGYHSIDQLTEVFGLTPETFETVKASVKADSTFIHKMNINTVEAKELKSHPYMTYAIANALVNYRKVHGPFSKISDIRNCALVNADLYRKIAPYLTL